MIVLALFLPVVVVPIAWRSPSAVVARRLGGYVALATAAAWLALLIVDPGASFGRFGVAPGAIGVWVLVASLSWPSRRVPLVLGVLAGGVTAGGLSLLAGTGDLSDAGGALAIASTLALVGARSEGDHGVRPALAGVLGAAAIAYGLTRLEIDTGAFVQGGGLLVVSGAVLVVVGAGGRARRVGVVVLPLALLLGVQAAAVLDDGMRVAVLVALVGVLVAARPAAALACWAIASAVVSLPAALLLGTAAVLVAALPHPLLPVVALPGAAVLAIALAHDDHVAGLVLAVLGTVLLARLWRTDRADVLVGRPAPPTIAAAALGAWLLLAPETWSWVGRAELAQWGTGVVIAAIAGGVGAFVLFSFSDEPFALPDLEVADPLYPPGDGRGSVPASIVSLAVLLVCGIALVASAAS